MVILAYTHKNSPRVEYIFRQVFRRLLGLEVKVTTSVADFIEYNGPKFSYAPRPLGSEVFFRSHGLLIEKGINEHEIRVFDWNEIPVFFPAPEGSALPWDPFASSFYLLTRYEEYLPHIKDKHDRFSAESSLAFQNDFLHIPVVDYYALAVYDVLKNQFPDLPETNRSYSFMSTIDVDNAFAYKHKGFIRVIGGLLKSVFQLDLQQFVERMQVHLGLLPDPFNTFDYLSALHRKEGVQALYFWLLADYGLNDKNVPITSQRFQALIKSVADHALVGIHPSYMSNFKPERLPVEINRLSSVVHQDVLRSRQHFLKMTLPETYQRLVEHDIRDDYTMGYASQPGFRAGTCSTYVFYDLDREIQLPLRIHPFAYMEGTFMHYLKMNPQEAEPVILSLIEQVKKVKGTFISLWHNDSVSEHGNWRGWRALYESTLRAAKA